MADNDTEVGAPYSLYSIAVIFCVIFLRFGFDNVVDINYTRVYYTIRLLVGWCSGKLLAVVAGRADASNVVSESQSWRPSQSQQKSRS